MCSLLRLFNRAPCYGKPLFKTSLQTLLRLHYNTHNMTASRLFPSSFKRPKGVLSLFKAFVKGVLSFV